MLNFGASKPRVKGGLGPRGPLDLHLFKYKVWNLAVMQGADIRKPLQHPLDVHACAR